MAKKILHGIEAQQALKRGIDAVAHAVRVTIGPRGKNVVYDKGYGSPVITNDGVSIAKEIVLSNKFENMGADIIKEVASKTNDTAGDGTTTSVVLTHAILTEGMKKTGTGVGGMMLRKGIDEATADVVEVLRAMATPIKNKEEVKQVATISAESSEIGSIIAETIHTVGNDGVVTVEESQTFGVTSEVVEGLEFDKGYVSAYMVTNPEKMTAEYQGVPVLVTDKKISAIKDILPLLESLAKAGKKELVIIAEDVDGEALATLVVNKVRGIFSVLAIKAPGFADRKKEMLGDIATVLGATFITEDLGLSLEQVDMSMLGKAGRVVSSKDSTVIVDGKGKKEAIKERIAQIKGQLLGASAAKFDKAHLKKRIAKLSSGVAVIKVGAATETEMKYLKLKIEDAVNATKAAIEEGIVPGGGVALAKAAKKVSEKMTNSPRYKKAHESKKEGEYVAGYMALVAALTAPLRQIVVNAGYEDAGVVIEKVQHGKDTEGYDASETSEGEIVLVDMVKKGIIDPVKVTRTALQNASSAAGIFLTTEVAIADEPEEKKISGGAHGEDMGY